MLLGIDFGTSYFKVGLFDHGGVLKGLGRVAVEKDKPGPGRSELPVPRFWKLLQGALGQALAQAHASANDISALSYSSQSNSFVLLDAADEPLTPLILWTDLRAEPVAPDLLAFSSTEEFAQAAGFSGWSAGFAVAKWRWFQENDSHTWTRARRVLTLPEYFTLALTGEVAGDASTAAFTGLYDLGRKNWWPAALDVARVQPGQLALPHRPGTLVAGTSRHATGLLGLPARLPFVVGGLDHHVAALGSGLGVHADVSISTGTVLAAMRLVDEPSPHPGCYHGPHFDGVQYYRLAFDPDGAGQLEEYQREHAPGISLGHLLEFAAQASSGAAATGNRQSEHGLAVRRLLEKISRTQRTLIEQVATGAPVSRLVATGGGARSALWLQIQADITGVPVLTPNSPERACLGAAMLASVATGRRRTLAEAVETMVTPGPVFEPGAKMAQELKR